MLKAKTFNSFDVYALIMDLGLMNIIHVLHFCVSHACMCEVPISFSLGFYFLFSLFQCVGYL